MSVSALSMPFTVPLFVSASDASIAAKKDANGATSSYGINGKPSKTGGCGAATGGSTLASFLQAEGSVWSSVTGSGGDLDFDLLAEYLLDEGTQFGGGFDKDKALPDFSAPAAAIAVSEASSARTTPDLSSQFPSSQVPNLSNIISQPLTSRNVASNTSSTPQVRNLVTSQAPGTTAPSTNKTSPRGTASLQPQHPITIPITKPHGSTVLPAAPVPIYTVGAPSAQALSAPPLAAPAHPVVMMAAPGTVVPYTHTVSAANGTTPGQFIMPPNQFPPMVVHQHRPAAAMVVNTSGSNKRPRAVTGSGSQPTSRRQKTQAQIDRRRERNRILARRTRLRKKFFFESLQKEVTDLQLENLALKEIVKTTISDQDAEKAKAILSQCTANESLPSIIAESCGMDSMEELDKQDFSLVRCLQKSQQSFVITDPSLQDNPIVYASEGFLYITGYARDEVLGRNCRFLQGTNTCESKTKEVRNALANGEDVSVCILNYTADGTPFWNQLFIAALRDANNNIVNFVGVICKVASPSPDDSEAGKKLPGEEDVSEDDVALTDDKLVSNVKVINDGSEVLASDSPSAADSQ